MTTRSSVRRARSDTSAPVPANDDTFTEGDNPLAGRPANDNPPVNDLPPCLEVTDDEVRLLHRYLGREILALFG